ncbi:MAG: MarC family protein [Elusimicrobiales bacterium]
MSFVTAVLTLFFVMDPLGNVPLFIAALKDVPYERKRRVIARELLIALGIMYAALLFGGRMLEWMGIDQPSLSIAGGIVLFLISVKMIFPLKEDGFAASPEGEPFIVPLAVPLIVGPSVASMVLIMPLREPDKMLQWVFVIAAAWVLNCAILLSSVRISRFLGERGMIAVTRLMGMLLTTISVQMFMSGIKQFLAR